jgi:hypothetical protein
MNSENLGSRLTENGAWNQKIWALKAFRDNSVILGGFGAILEFLEWLEGLGAKDTGSCEIEDFLGILWNFGGFERA